MLSIRIFHLLALGLCLILIAKYMQLMQVSVRGLDHLLARRFFDVDGLTTEIRAWVERPHDAAPGQHPLRGRVGRNVYLWLCHRLRQVAGLDSGAD
ncbi:MAG: hypothetical protein OXN23_00835 [Gammaproteobacteria bacterium]|nr:hypothetical protein [Gammaproteobacteria bacterium]MDE0303249.1 hypothetical protein [Gammaproteobacteria bacterium]MDE0612302.1 hypothetical protein [Gammaproteobacteria bacterium]